MKLGWKLLAWGAAIAVIAVALAWLWRPAPVEVETARVVRGPLVVSVEEQGETRAHERYVVAAPVAGRLERIELHEGDAVRAGQPLAVLHPAPLSAQEREAQLARVAGAQALVREAQDMVRKARASLEQSRRDRERTQKLVKEGFLAPQAAERAVSQETELASEVDAALARARSAAAQLEVARAALPAELAGAAGKPLQVRSPAEGRVLRVPERSERVVAAGTPLLVVGDPGQLEMVVDVLSSEAVRVRPGMRATIEAWGGGDALPARVRTVEPSAFTKVSALGVEEQRVNVVLDFETAPAALGDGFRARVRIVTLEKAQALKVPASAVFRSDGEESVFAVEGDRARRRVIGSGARNRDEVEVVSGLDEGATVVRFVSNALADGVRVRLARR